MFENQEKSDIFCDFQTLWCDKDKTLSVMMSPSFSLSCRLIGQHWIFCPSMSQINLRNWVRILLRSGSPFLRRVINLKSRADHGHSDDVVADTQGHCISGGNEPNLIRLFDVSYVVKKVIPTNFVENLFDSHLTFWSGFQAITTSSITVSPVSFLMYSILVCL